MLQAVVTEPGHLSFNQVPQIESLGRNEVLLKIKRIGICGSDIHVYHGEHPAVVYPVVQGHEYAAVVERIGADVQNIKPGMQVTARPQLVCGSCPPCLRGQYNVCQNLKVQGFQAPGVAQEFFVCSQERIVVLPDTMSLDYGAMVEPVSVAVHATYRPTSLTGKNVVVAGAGTIGNLIAQMARIRGAKKVLITDISEYRLEIARQCGIAGTVHVAEHDLKEAAADFFQGEGFQVAFEAAGVQSSLTGLIAHIEKGSEVIVVGVYAQNPVVNMFHLGEHELLLKGSLMYKHEDYLEAVERINAGELRLDPIISKHFAFKAYPEAYAHIEQAKDKVLKVIIDM